MNISAQINIYPSSDKTLENSFLQQCFVYMYKQTYQSENYKLKKKKMSIKVDVKTTMAIVKLTLKFSHLVAQFFFSLFFIL